MKTHYYKLTMRCGGGENETSVDYYNDLDKMCEEIWHHGAKGFPCFDKVEEITEEEYNENLLPI